MEKGTSSDPFGSGDDDAANNQEGGIEDDVGDSSSQDNRPEDLDEQFENEPLTNDAIVEQSIETVNDGGAPDLPQAVRNDSGVPWVYTRSNVKDSRDIVQFYLREAVQTAEDDFVDAVSDEFGAGCLEDGRSRGCVRRGDTQPELVSEELERWGSSQSDFCDGFYLLKYLCTQTDFLLLDVSTIG